jgi:hypothetical protein
MPGHEHGDEADDINIGDHVRAYWDGRADYVIGIIKKLPSDKKPYWVLRRDGSRYTLCAMSGTVHVERLDD